MLHCFKVLHGFTYCLRSSGLYKFKMMKQSKNRYFAKGKIASNYSLKPSTCWKLAGEKRFCRIMMKNEKTLPSSLTRKTRITRCDTASRVTGF